LYFFIVVAAEIGGGVDCLFDAGNSILLKGN